MWIPNLKSARRIVEILYIYDFGMLLESSNLPQQDERAVNATL